jgi:hypothetical protein
VTGDIHVAATVIDDTHVMSALLTGFDQSLG